jgi:mitochondrial fission protein ELM1
VRGCAVLAPCADAARNPYAGLLAWAHALIVTADSVNMVTEALATARRACGAAAPAPDALTCGPAGGGRLLGRL